MPWKKLLHRLSSSQYLRHIATLMSGNSGAMLINVLLTIALTRVYAPHDFGVFAVFVSSATIFSVLGSGKYDSTIVLPKRNKEAYHLLIISLLLLSAVVLVLFLVIYHAGPHISDLLPEGLYSDLIYFLPVSVFMLGVAQTFNAWFTRSRSFGVISSGKIISVFVSGIMALLIGVWFDMPGGLILGVVAGQSLSALFLFANFLSGFEGQGFKPGLSSILNTMKEYADFPVFGLVSDGLNTISREVPNYMLAAFFGNATVGFYNMALRLLNLPKAIISLTVGEVYYERASRAGVESAKSLGNITRKTLFLLSILSISTLLPIFFFADFIFPAVFGEGWAASATMARLLTPWMLVWFISSPMAYIFYVRRKLGILLAFQVVSFVARIASIYLGAQTGSDLSAVFYFAMANFVVDGVMIFFIIRQASFKGFHYDTSSQDNT